MSKSNAASSTAPEPKAHIAFWRTIAESLSAGKSVVESLWQAVGTGSPEFQQIGCSMVDAIEKGKTLSQAMEPHRETFGGSICTMVRAGEAGGVLDVIAGRIADALAEGSFGPPAGEKDDPARFWRAFGRLLSSGVPILTALELVSAEASGADLAEAALAIREAVAEGRHISEAMRERPGLFPELVCRAMDAGEQAGECDLTAFRIADALDAGDLSRLAGQIAALGGGTEDSDPRAKEYVNSLLLEAVKAGATDLHFDPSEGRGHVRMRVDGVLRPVEPPPPAAWDAVVSRIKIMAALDLAERRRPQDGIVLIDVNGRKMDIRVSVLPVWGGERVVLRLITRDQVCLDMNKLGMSDEDLARARGLCELPSGLVIVTGPTGSGKTTTVYAMLQSINQPERAILTAEDPVEYLIDGIAQTPVNPKVGMTFPKIIRHMLRQAPNVMMVGEIRDLETAELCVQAALTGHLLFTQLHTDTAADAIKRLLDIGVKPFLINAALKGVIAQRLVRRLCPQCAKPVKPDAHTIPPQAAEMIARLKKPQFLGPIGCDACGHTGYRGRTAIYEVMVVDDAIREIISGSADLAALEAAARAAGMRTMLADGVDKAAAGETSLEELMRTAPRAMRG